MDLLIQKILEKEPAAVWTANELGATASSNIKPLARSEDPGVREIALRCLNRSGGSGVGEMLVKALSDEAPGVRAAALQGLSNHLNEDTYPRLLDVYEKVPDAQHRQEIALMLGKINGANLRDLKRLCESEQNPEALEGCLAALAKLGEPRSQAEFLNRLRNSKDRRLKRFLEYVDYIGQIWALRGLEPVLGDIMPLVGIGVCPLPEGEPGYLRAGDLAVNLVAKIARVQFSFPVDSATNYTDLQILEARRFLETLA